MKIKKHHPLLALSFVFLMSGCTALPLDAPTKERLSNYPQCAILSYNYGFFNTIMSDNYNNLVKPCLELKEKEHNLKKYPTCKESIEKSYSAGAECMKKKDKENQEATLAREKKDRIEKMESEIAAKNKRNKETRMCFAVINKVSKSHGIGKVMKLTHVEDHGDNFYRCVALYNKNGRASMYSVMHNNKNGKNTVELIANLDGPAWYY